MSIITNVNIAKTISSAAGTLCSRVEDCGEWGGFPEPGKPRGPDRPTRSCQLVQTRVVDKAGMVLRATVAICHPRKGSPREHE